MPIETMKPCRTRRINERRSIKTMLTFTEVLELVQRQVESGFSVLCPIGASRSDFDRIVMSLQSKGA